MAWAPSYASTEELANFVRIRDTLDDSSLSLALATASRAIDRACGRQFGQVDAPTARYYPPPKWDARNYRWHAPIDDLMTTTGLAVDFDGRTDHSYSTSVTEYLLRPLNAAGDGLPWTEYVVHASAANPAWGAFGTLNVLYGPREDAVRITARWGWSAVPDPIRQACLLQASRLLARRDSPFGVAGSPEAGSELRLLSQLDADVMVAVRPYRRIWGAV